VVRSPEDQSEAEMHRRLERKEDSKPRLSSAAYQLQDLAADERIPPDVRTGAAQLAGKLQGLVRMANQRRRAVESVLGEVTGEYDEHDVRWIESRQRATDESLQTVMEQRFALTAARALRKAAEGQRYAGDYLSAARKVASGEWHYLDLCPILACAPSDLKMTNERAYALERNDRRLRALYRYWEDVAAVLDPPDDGTASDPFDSR
jgi:hypothetical protein